jgi:hypothetical protein
MADNDLFSDDDEENGPALFDREPIVLAEERKNAVERVRSFFDR